MRVRHSILGLTFRGLVAPSTPAVRFGLTRHLRVVVECVALLETTISFVHHLKAGTAPHETEKRRSENEPNHGPSSLDDVKASRNGFRCACGRTPRASMTHARLLTPVFPLALACIFVGQQCALPSLQIEDTSGTCGGFSYGAETCSACMRASCCTESTACAQTSSCSTVYGCLARCATDGAEACREDCMNRMRSPTAFDEATGAPEANLVACRARACASSCATGAYQGALRTCAVCMRDRCAEASTACSQDVPCAKLDYCVTRALTPWSMAHCEQVGGGASTHYDAVNGCSWGYCRDECTGLWACRGNTRWPNADAQVTMSLLFSDFLTGAPVTGVTVNACARDDKSCVSRVATGVSDSAGVASLVVPNLTPQGFDGFAEVPDGGLYPTLYFWNAPWFESTHRKVGAVPKNAMPTLVGSLGRRLDPAKGLVGISIQDCLNHYAKGVQFFAMSSFELPVVYTEQELPVVTRTETSEDGIGFFPNMEPGTVTVWASVVSTGEEILRTSVEVRAGWFTVLQAWPVSR